MLKKLLLAGALVGVGVFAGGCAVTDYGNYNAPGIFAGGTQDPIRDNHTLNVQQGEQQGIVITDGEAHLLEGIQVATLWPDGGGSPGHGHGPGPDPSSEELMSFVDQHSGHGHGADVVRTLRTRALVVDGANFAAGNYWHDDQYVTPAHDSCVDVIAEDSNLPAWLGFPVPNPSPATLDDVFDYSFDATCPGLRSLAYLTSENRFYGEAGKASRLFPRLNGTSLSDSAVLSLIDRGRPVAGGVQLDINARTVQNFGVEIRLPNGQTTTIPVDIPANGNLPLILDNSGRGLRLVFNFAAPSAAPVVDAWLDAIDAARAAAGAPSYEIVGYTGTLFGIELSGFPSGMRMALRPGFDTDAVRQALVGATPVTSPISVGHKPGDASARRTR